MFLATCGCGNKPTGFFFQPNGPSQKLDVKKPWASKRHSSLQDNSSRCFLLCILNAQKQHGHAMRLVRNSSLNGNGMVNLEEDSRNYWHQHWLLVKARGGNRLREYWKIKYNIIHIYIYRAGSSPDRGALRETSLNYTYILTPTLKDITHEVHAPKWYSIPFPLSLSLFKVCYVGWRFSIWWLIQLNSLHLIIATDPSITGRLPCSSKCFRWRNWPKGCRKEQSRSKTRLETLHRVFLTLGFRILHAEPILLGKNGHTRYYRVLLVKKNNYIIESIITLGMAPSQ